MFEPNIDEKGRRVRAIGGVVALVIFAILLVVPGNWSTLRIVAAVIVLVIGLFMLYEAKRKWCALRACGIKTRL